MKKKIIFVFVLIMIIGYTSIRYVQKNNIGKNTPKELININKLSEEFMDNYYEDIKKLNEEGNFENILIVISKRDVKDGFGAKKVIKSPNNQYILQYDSKESKEKAKEELQKDSNVLSVEENVRYEYVEVETVSGEGSYNSWGIESMGLDSIIDKLKDESVSDVRVAVLDSGCNEELVNKYFEGKLIETKNIVKNNNDVTDNNGHGTHIAGTIAEGTPNNVKIIAVKQENDAGMIELVNMVAALNWITYNEKADVINMSFGGEENSEILYQVIESAKENNIICVAAAGNNNTSRKFYPAAYDNTISIASVDSNLLKSDFSNYGNSVDFATPGTSIKSLMAGDTDISEQNRQEGLDDNDDEFETISGTSMATPHAVCAAAIVKSLNKNLDMDSVADVLKKQVLDLGPEGRDDIFGYGFIDFATTNVCKGVNCDDYNVFEVENSKTKKIEAVQPEYDSLYNYGNDTNLLNMQVKIYYDDDKYYIRDLGELTNYTIDNYDPYLEGEQIVTIGYGDHSTTVTVNNYLNDGWYSWVYSEQDKTAVINGMYPEENYPKYVTVPATYKGYEIIQMNNVFHEREELRSVEILPEITEIQSGEFAECSNLEKVILPDSVTFIGDGAFINDRKMTNFEFPANLEEIDEYSFNGTGFTSLTIPSRIKNIPRGAFGSMWSLTEVTIEDGIESIGSEAFFGDNALTSITIPKTVTSIDVDAFKHDYYIDNINVDEENTVYESVEDSNTIVEIATKTLVFANSNSTIPADVHTIGAQSIQASMFSLPDTVTTLEDYALYGVDCVVLPRTINTISSEKALEREWEGGLNLVYNDSYIHNYLVDNELPYNIIDSRRLGVQLADGKENFSAFEKVEDYIATVYIEVDGDETRGWLLYTWYTGKNYEIYYNNGTDSFRYGDEYYMIEIYDDVLEEHYYENIAVTVLKATPDYTVPTGLSIEAGQALSTVSLPQGFSWKEPNTIANVTGEQTFLATYTPQDTDNYEIVDDIEITVTVNTVKEMINPTITISNKTYDGTNVVNPESVTVSNLQAGEYTIVSVTSENINVGAATATVTLRLSNDKYTNYAFEGNVQEKAFNVNYTITKATHVITYHANNGTEDTDTQEMQTSTETAIKQNTFTKTDYVFKEWNTQADGNGTSYSDDQVISVTSNLDLYAIWVEGFIIKNYTVDITNKIISKIPDKTQVNTFTSYFTLASGFGTDVDTVEYENKELVYTGGKTRITKGLELFDEYTNIVMGDSEPDGVVDSADLLSIRLHMRNMKTLEDVYFTAADIDKDSDLTSADLLAVRLHIKGKLPIE